jgi:uncharacterized protein (AIM24 family)
MGATPDADNPGWFSWGDFPRGSFAAATGRLLFKPDGAGRAICRMFPTEAHMNMGGSLHGGSVMSFIDMAMFAGGLCAGMERGHYVTLVELNNETLTVEADRLLAHHANLSTSVEMIGQGGIRQAVRGAMSGQGLFTTKVSGSGSVALLSHGGTFEIPVNGELVGVDPQAYVGHVGALQVDFKVSGGIRDVVGRGSGEATQLHCTGHGRVYIQASEEKFQ